jgi:multiple sugar transport system permease protein
MWKLIYDPSFGILNYLLGMVRLPQPNWLGSGSMAMRSVVIVDIWQWTPFVALIVLAGLQGIPKHLYEAADVDGASCTGMFYSITLPLIRPTLLVAVLFKFIYSLKTFDIVYGLTFGGPGSATEILNIFIYRTSFYFMRMGRGATIAVMLLFATIGICSAIARLLTTRSAY